MCICKKCFTDGVSLGTGLADTFEKHENNEKKKFERSFENHNATICSRIVQHLSVAMVAVTAYYLWTGRKEPATADSTNMVFVHFLSLAAHFGAQCWVTFVAGFTMFFNLPRIMFGRLQSRLFPLYFGSTLMLSCITLVTYVRRNNFESLDSTHTNQLLLHIVCVICTFINSCFLAPRIVDSMVVMFELEKASGVAYSIGYCDRTELKKNAEYCQYYKQFRRVHSISGVVNIVTLVCNVMYIYGLACMAASSDIFTQYCENS